MENDRAQNEFFESMLSAAIKENHKRELELIPTTEEINKQLEFSSDFMIKMKKIFSTLKREKITKQFFTYSKRVAVIALIVMSISFGAMMLSPEVRAAVQQTVIKWFDEYTNLKFFDDASDKLPSLQFNYIPTEYTKVDENIFEQGSNISYVNKLGQFLVIECTFATDEYEVNIDNENCNFKEVDINGMKAYLFTGDKKSGNTLVWHKDNTVINIFSDEKNINQMVKIAENIK